MAARLGANLFQGFVRLLGMSLVMKSDERATDLLYGRFEY